MPRTLDPFRLLLFAVAGWMNHQQQQIIDYLREENRVLHTQLGTRLRFDDEQRRRLAVRAKLLGRRVLAEVASYIILAHWGVFRFVPFSRDQLALRKNGTMRRRQSSLEKCLRLLHGQRTHFASGRCGTLTPSIGFSSNRGQCTACRIADLNTACV